MTQVDKRLLVLDDDPVVETAIGLIAEGAGFAWKSARTEEDFFELVQQWCPTHIVIDLQRADWKRVLDRLGLQGCKVPIVLASDMESRVMGAISAGLAQKLDVLGSVTKPLDALALRVLLLGSTGRRENSQSFATVL